MAVGFEWQPLTDLPPTWQELHVEELAVTLGQWIKEKVNED